MVSINSSALSISKEVALFFGLVSFEALIFWFDVSTGDEVSLQPLFILPVVIAGVLLSNISVFLLCILSTLLRVEAYKQSAFRGDDFPYLSNFAASFAAISLVGFVVVFARHYRDLAIAHQESSVGRRLKSFTENPDE